MRKYKNENVGVRYLVIVAVDCFSKLVSVQPSKSKEGSSVKPALQKVLVELGEMQIIQFDKELEMHNKIVKDFLTKKKLKLYTFENEGITCALAAFDCTLKSRIFQL